MFSYWREQGYARITIIVGHLLALVYFAHGLITTNMPRTLKTSPLREELRGWHYLAGTLLGILVIWMLVRWWKDRPVTPGLNSAGGHRWGRALTLTSLLLLAISPFMGLLNAWSDGLSVHFGPTPAIPQLVEEDRALWQFAGYFHSGIGFAQMLIMFGTVLSAGVMMALRGVGLFRAFPPGFGLMALLSTCVSVYANATFKSPDPGPRAVATWLAIIAGVGLIGWAISNWRRKRGVSEARARGWHLPAAALGAAAIAGVGLYGPYAYFRVTPFSGPITVKADRGVTSYDSIVTRVTVTPETAFERQVKGERFKWCGFCHTFNKGGKHLVGPNLYGVFGRPIASVPNFPYSPGLVAQRAPGRVWDDATMAQFLSDPDKFAPGTAMVVSSGNPKSREEVLALVNLLKKETMKGHYTEAPSAPR